jgi:hypothetical protein
MMEDALDTKTAALITLQRETVGGSINNSPVTKPDMVDSERARLEEENRAIRAKLNDAEQVHD